jgi:SAM-dependent methyltransferase
MFIEEAAWLRRELAGIELGAGFDVLNVASSTEHYRTVEQPHNESEVLAPLRARGAKIDHLDIKDAPGVDLVVDLTAPDLDLSERLRSYDLVLATGLLQHFDVEDARRVCAELVSVTKPGGFLVITTPLSYRLTPDPVDFGFRPTPADLVGIVRAAAPVTVVAQEAVRIDHPQYYRGVVSRASVVPFRGRWVPLLGASEQVRRLVPRWRWRETCVIVRREPEPVAARSAPAPA